tara:strand:- start:4 stop:519 length:516 start_codon:yes stop_codon:yes gene_type:complete
MNSVRVTVAYFVRGGQRSKGKIIDELLIDLGRADNEPLVDFLLSESSVFSSHPSAKLNEATCYILWKEAQLVRVTDLGVIRDGDSLYVSNSSHQSALESFLEDNKEKQDKQDNISTTDEDRKKRRREHYGSTVQGRLQYHIQHRYDNNYNCHKKRYAFSSYSITSIPIFVL